MHISLFVFSSCCCCGHKFADAVDGAIVDDVADAVAVDVIATVFWPTKVFEDVAVEAVAESDCA